MRRRKRFTWILRALGGLAAGCAVALATFAWAWFSRPAPTQPGAVRKPQEVAAVLHGLTGAPPDGREGGGAGQPAAIASGGVVIDRRVINGHEITLCEPPADEPWRAGRAVAEITGPDGMRSTVDFASRIDPVSGTDITGDGIPEVVIERDSGGAGCCVSYVIESLGERARTIPLPLSSPSPATFLDLDGDGAFEVIGTDASFRCTLCCCANSPEPVVVLKYVEGQGYVPASPEFPEVYDALIPEYRARAEVCQHGPFEEQDPTGRCCILPLVLALLYSGRAGSAWDAAAQYFQSAGAAAALRAEVEEIVAGSRLYVAQDWGKLLATRQVTFSVLADLDGDGADETILGIGAEGADKVAEFMRPGDVYVCSSASTAQAPDVLFACRTALSAGLLPGFFEAQPVCVGDLDHDGLDEVVLVWLEQYWWPTAIRPLAVLQFSPADGAYEMVTDISRFTCEIGDYAAEDVDGDGRIELLEIRPIYGSDVNPIDGTEELECHFCPHRYEVRAFEFTGQAFLADEDVNGGLPFVTTVKYAPYLGDGPVTSFLPELIASIRSLVGVP